MTQRSPIPVPITWPLLTVPDEGGRLRYPADLDASVRQRIEAILSVRPGEQLQRPRFGAGLVRFIDQPDTVQTRRRIRDAVSEALGRYETRIDVDRVDVLDGDGPGRLRVEIHYRLRRTGSNRRFGLTLQLGA